MQIFQETTRLHRLTKLGMINCFLLAENDGSATLIDTSLPGSAPAILKAARKLDSPIRRIVLTHAHADHIGSLDVLRDKLPNAEIYIGAAEAPLLAGDYSSYGLSPGQRPFGFMNVRTTPKLLKNMEMVGSLQTIFSPGHTPGHVAYFDVRDGSLIGGDSFTTQMGVVAAGVFKIYFPFPAWFSWNRNASAASARKLCELQPARLSAGHGVTIANPLAAMERATELAFQQASRTSN